MLQTVTEEAEVVMAMEVYWPRTYASNARLMVPVVNLQEDSSLCCVGHCDVSWCIEVLA